MKKICTAVMALAIAGASLSPAMAGVPSGNYLVTITHGRGVPVGSTYCFTLAQTGGVLGFTNSGTVTVDGFTGNYYVLRSVLTATVDGVVLSGTLYHNAIINTSIWTIGSSGFSGVGTFSAVYGGC